MMHLQYSFNDDHMLALIEHKHYEFFGWLSVTTHFINAFNCYSNEKCEIKFIFMTISAIFNFIAVENEKHINNTRMTRLFVLLGFSSRFYSTYL